MNRTAHLLLALIATPFVAAVQAQNGVVDLTALANYANQAKPSYITKSNTPASNPITDAGATLGRVLFYDKRLSRDGTVSCASCHQQAHGFSDGALASSGVAGTTSRHTMRLVNARFGRSTFFFWDERATSLEDQATQPIRNHVEMGFSGGSGDPSFADLIIKLSAISDYRVLFTFAFGTAVIDETKIQDALAQFVRSIQSFDSKYDTGRAFTADSQPFANFTAAENAGKQLFLNPPSLAGAGCAACHRPPEFDVDPGSLNNGVIGAIGGGTDLTNMRSPSLRDLIGPGGLTNGPFMHNGVFTTLAQVVNHYNAIPADNPSLDPRLRRPGGVQNLNLTQTQKDNLVAFMQTLTGNTVYTAAKWSDPFSSTGELSISVLSTNGTTLQKHNDGTTTLSCKATPGFQYQLQSSSDLQNWTTVGTPSPDVNGNLTSSVSTSGTVFYRYAFTPP